MLHLIQDDEQKEMKKKEIEREREERSHSKWQFCLKHSKQNSSTIKVSDLSLFFIKRFFLLICTMNELNSQSKFNSYKNDENRRWLTYTVKKYMNVIITLVELSFECVLFQSETGI